MSAYMVDREHIAYLLDAAMHPRIRGQHNHSIRWYAASERRSCELAAGDFNRAAAVGQMLWDANRCSIEARYPDTVDDFSRAPGPIGESFSYDRHCGNPWAEMDPLQVIKACHCFTYQACEYEGWRDSEARAFIEAPIGYATRALPGYDDAEWGAPMAA